MEQPVTFLPKLKIHWTTIIMDTQLIQYAKAQQTFPNSFNTQEFTSNYHKYLFLRMDDIRMVINISVNCSSLPFLTCI